MGVARNQGKTEANGGSPRRTALISVHTLTREGCTVLPWAEPRQGHPVLPGMGKKKPAWIRSALPRRKRNSKEPKKKSARQQDRSKTSHVPTSSANLGLILMLLFGGTCDQACSLL